MFRVIPKILSNYTVMNERRSIVLLHWKIWYLHYFPWKIRPDEYIHIFPLTKLNLK